MTDILANLNDAQLRAVTAPEGPVLVVAGAGSGKTRVLTTRIAWLLGERGVHPGGILAYTFTNRAAREMRERVGKTVGEARAPFWIGTFHATGPEDPAQRRRSRWASSPASPSSTPTTACAC